MREERIENNEVSGLTMLLSLVIIRAERSERERDQINKRRCDEQMRPGEERRGYGERRLRGNQVSLMNARVSRGDGGCGVLCLIGCRHNLGFVG